MSTFKVGDNVRIGGRVTKLVRRLSNPPGAWEVSPAVGGFRLWNESEMRPVRLRSRHIKLDAVRGRFVCLRCGGTKAAKLPMQALEYARAVDAFWQEHAGCADSGSAS